MRGLDPRIHLSEKKMDCRVKPGNDTVYYPTSLTSQSRYFPLTPSAGSRTISGTS
jgi:hypothetical protein